MKRRDAIKRTAILMGYAVSASAISGVMSGCQADTDTPMDEWKPSAFSEVQLNTVREAADRIVPATEGIVGAKDVQVERFLDELVGKYLSSEESTGFKQGLDNLEAQAQAKFSKSFAKLDTEKMDELITQIMNEATAPKANESNMIPFFFGLKGATLLGYFTSEKVGEEVLNYDPIPTKYEGCIPMSDVPNGHSWSL